ncbi:hypothetical protein BaRGS_00012736 [Batillaria attramentaria]|uniref:Uncharacterized protein n=1 Tax=Batillaria attramentaria TaxID=370345 RepID=A0ABD0L9P0_9CAEN
MTTGDVTTATDPATAVGTESASACRNYSRSVDSNSGYVFGVNDKCLQEHSLVYSPSPPVVVVDRAVKCQV